MSDGPAYYYRFSGLYAAHLSVPPFSRWVEENHASLMAHLPALSPGNTVLEIGGGIGRLSQLLADHYPDCAVTSIDASEDMTRRAHAMATHPNLAFETRSFWDETAEYDLVICAGCWEFFEQAPSAEQLVRLIRPGGMAIINTLGPAPFSSFRKHLFRIVWGTEMWLHRPDMLADQLRRRGCLVRWQNVNPVEGSYTLMAIRGG